MKIQRFQQSEAPYYVIFNPKVSFNYILWGKLLRWIRLNL